MSIKPNYFPSSTFAVRNFERITTSPDFQGIPVM